MRERVVVEQVVRADDLEEIIELLPVDREVAKQSILGSREREAGPEEPGKSCTPQVRWAKRREEMADVVLELIRGDAKATAHLAIQASNSAI